MIYPVAVQDRPEEVESRQAAPARLHRVADDLPPPGDEDMSVYPDPVIGSDRRQRLRHICSGLGQDHLPLVRCEGKPACLRDSIL